MTESHIVQFSFSYYRGDSIIKSDFDLNDRPVYCIDDDKVYEKKWGDEGEPFFKEMGEESDGDTFYFYTPKDVFFIEYLHEIGDIQYDRDSYTHERWLDNTFCDYESEVLTQYLPKIYEDVKDYINEFLTRKPHLCMCGFEKLLHLVSMHTQGGGYDCVEYDLNIYYVGVYELVAPPLSQKDVFELQHGMSMEAYQEMEESFYDSMIGSMADYNESNKT